MNENIKIFREKTVTPGFVKALCNDDLIYDITSQYIDYSKKLYAAIDDDTKNDEFRTVEKISEIIYIEGAEIFNISDSDSDDTILIYKSTNNIVLFIIKKQYLIAIWNE